MSKRWATWPRGIQWLVWIAAVVLALAIAWALFAPVADWLAHHDVGSAKGPLHETALDNARGRLLALGAGLFAAGALIFTARNFTLSRRTLDVTEQGQVTDRYTKAIEQLGSDKLDVRIGGIYALERVARDSARDHPTVMEVLSAFVREHSHESWPLPGPGVREPERSTRPDVQAAVTVIGRRDAKCDIRGRRINLSRADLTRADLPGATLAGADFSGATLGGADLRDANLDGATLDYADLRAADLSRANLTGAWLSHAHLDGATLFSADLPGATLQGATLTAAWLGGANLTGAWMPRANLTGAHLEVTHLDGAQLADAHLDGATLTTATLTGANLAGATLGGADLGGANFGGAHLNGATWPADTPVPEGWKLDIGSGRLVATGTDSGPTEAN